MTGNPAEIPAGYLQNICFEPYRHSNLLDDDMWVCAIRRDASPDTSVCIFYLINSMEHSPS